MQANARMHKIESEPNTDLPAHFLLLRTISISVCFFDRKLDPAEWHDSVTFVIREARSRIRILIDDLRILANQDGDSHEAIIAYLNSLQRFDRIFPTTGGEGSSQAEGT